jgi:beta-lactam-binding protein with PASTA domain
VSEQQVDVTDEGQDGTVVQQDPSGGKAKPGSKVTIGVGSFTPPPETNPSTGGGTP